MPEATIVIAPAPAALSAVSSSHPRRLACYLQARERRHSALQHTPSAHTILHHTTLSFISPVLVSTILLSLVGRTRRLSTQRAGTQAREFHCSARHPALKLHRPHTHARRQLSTCFTLTAQPSSTLRRRAAQSKAPLSTHHHHPSRLPHCTSYTTLSTTNNTTSSYPTVCHCTTIRWKSRPFHLQVETDRHSIQPVL